MATQIQEANTTLDKDKMKIIFTSSPNYTDYTVSTLEKSVILINFQPQASIEDSLPLYPAAFYVDAKGVMGRIELLHGPQEWEHRSIKLPSSISAAGINFTDKGEASDEMSVEGDIYMYFDKSADILEFQVSEGDGEVISLGGDVAVKASRGELRSLFLLGYSKHSTG